MIVVMIALFYSLIGWAESRRENVKTVFIETVSGHVKTITKLLLH